MMPVDNMVFGTQPFRFRVKTERQQLQQRNNTMVTLK